MEMWIGLQRVYWCTGQSSRRRVPFRWQCVHKKLSKIAEVHLAAKEHERSQSQHKSEQRRPEHVDKVELYVRLPQAPSAT